MTVPEICKRDGVPCAYRTFLGGGAGRTACGYLLFTGKARGKIEGKKYTPADPEECDKWSDERKAIEDDGDFEAGVPDIDNSAECDSSRDVLRNEGLEESLILAVCSGT